MFGGGGVRRQHPPPTTELVPPQRPDRTPPASDWWVFPGGFWVDRPGCYTLRLKNDNGSTPLRVPLGNRCWSAGSRARTRA